MNCMSTSTSIPNEWEFVSDGGKQMMLFRDASGAVKFSVHVSAPGRAMA